MLSMVPWESQNLLKPRGEILAGTQGRFPWDAPALTLLPMGQDQGWPVVSERAAQTAPFLRAMLSAFLPFGFHPGQ